MHSPISAYGKVILLGEHAVVYQRPALALGLADGITVSDLQATSGVLQVRVPAWELDENERGESAIAQALRRLDELVPGSAKGFSITLETQLPLGAGLGSSAALAVVLAKALCRIRNVAANSESIHELAHELEIVFHGRPSGLDDTLATYGGLCLFRRDGFSNRDRQQFWRYRALTEKAFSLPFPLPSLVVGHSGVPRETARMVAMVKQRYEDAPDTTNVIFDDIAGCVQAGLKALEKKNLQDLGAAMNRNQQHLAELGLSCPEIDRMIQLAQDAGAPGVKLTGAGGGGCVIALAGEHRREIERAWQSTGFRTCQF